MTSNPFSAFTMAGHLPLLLLLCCLPRPAAAQALQVGADFRPISVLECSQRALVAMRDEQNFIHAEINGMDAWGYDEKSFVIVHAVPVVQTVSPFNNGVDIFVVAFSIDDREAERLRNAIREKVFDHPLQDNHIINPYQTFDANRHAGPLSVQWGNFNKVATEPVFQSCARGAMAHNGLHETASGNQLIFGRSSTTAMVALGVGQPRGTQVLVIAASRDAKEAERLRNVVRTSIIGCSSL